MTETQVLHLVTLQGVGVNFFFFLTISIAPGFFSLLYICMIFFSQCRHAFFQLNQHE